MAILSDKSISGDLLKARVVSRKKQHKDLDLSLKIHPIRKDIIPLKDDNAIKNAVRNLLVSNFFERPFQPSLGANLRGLLFEPMGGITKMNLKENIQRVLVRHEKRIEVLNIAIKEDIEGNSYHATVEFRIKETDTVNDVEIVLRRLR
tara:strand:- start:2742 stop:3185 length:444 start_codon:yes stop_codon:yes gene_type:complete